ncbi:MAG TPA: NAD(P)-dependent alcohol dehydrogenase [Gammaproteobacteria bacterium]|nr:NAD(P)-dependent alcohol dehydrogenase [Gammaproteobacteria bacterium]
MHIEDLRVPPLGDWDIKVRVHAVALNRRDLIVANGEHGPHSGKPLIPCSDAAGEVIAVGRDVTRFKLGDRVINAFFPGWVEGELSVDKVAHMLGFPGDGVLAEETVGNESGWVPMPKHLDYLQAATLTCTGVTAWNALFEQAPPRPGDTVLLLGTGGVSIWALLLAKAAGLRTVITSSSESKLVRARKLGASYGINYIAHPDWEREVLRVTDGRGVDLAIDVSGGKTISRSLEATRPGGTVAVTGALTGINVDINLLALLVHQKRLVGVRAGSRSMLEALSTFTEVTGLKPMVDKVFAFSEAPRAFEYLASGTHFGKVVIQVEA